MFSLSHFLTFELIAGLEKRKAAEKAETDFFGLLREKAIDKIKPDAIWKDVSTFELIGLSVLNAFLKVKRGLDKDPRYDAVGSSSLREELFNTFVKTLTTSESSADPKTDKLETSHADNETERKRKDKERKERAVREREEQVKRDRRRVEAELARTRNALDREQGESEFLCAFYLYVRL